MEQQKIRIQNYPKMIQEFAYQNFNLKILSLSLLVLTFLMLILVIFLVKRGPLVIALDNTGEIAKVETKVTDLQIASAVKQYLSYRYNWDYGDIPSQLKKAEYFVHPSLVSAFRKSMMEVQKFVLEKKVKQRVYPKVLPNSVNVNIKDKTVTVLADRITEFENLKAATELKLVLQFTVDDRSVINPWGVYITKESEGEK